MVTTLNYIFVTFMEPIIFSLPSWSQLYFRYLHGANYIFVTFMEPIIFSLPSWSQLYFRYLLIWSQFIQNQSINKMF